MDVALPLRQSIPLGQAELVVDGQHFYRVVRDGMLKAKVSLDIATADFKAMLVPEAGSNRRIRSWKFSAGSLCAEWKSGSCTRARPAPPPCAS